MKIGGLVEQKELALYSITSLPDKPGAAAQVLKLFAQNAINLQYVTESTAKDGTAILAFCVNCSDKELVDRLIKENIKYDEIQIKKTENVGLIGIYGPHFREKPSIAAQFCETLGSANINILGISSSISTISCLVDIRDFDRAIDALMNVFELP